METAVLRTNKSRKSARYSTHKTSVKEDQVLRSTGKVVLQVVFQLIRLPCLLRHEENVKRSPAPKPFHGKWPERNVKSIRNQRSRNLCSARSRCDDEGFLPRHT